MAEEKDKDDLIPGGDFNEDAPTPETPDDAADALAVALTHAQTNKMGGLFSM